MMENNFLPTRIKMLLLFDLLFMMFRRVLSFFDVTTSFSKVSSKLANFDMPDAIQWLLRVYCNVYIFVKTVSAASAFFPPTMFLPCPVCPELSLRFILWPLTSIPRPPLIAHPPPSSSPQKKLFILQQLFCFPSPSPAKHLHQRQSNLPFPFSQERQLPSPFSIFLNFLFLPCFLDPLFFSCRPLLLLF